MAELTKEYLCELFDYNSETGDLIWKVPRGQGTEPGDIVKCKRTGGYLVAVINGKQHAAHRIIWVMMHGYWPREIDHINGITDDNRLENLRDVTSQENARNMAMRSDNTSGVCGVTFVKRVNKWKAQININGENKYIGYFDNLDKAAEAVAKVRRENGYTKRHGQPAKKNG